MLERKTTTVPSNERFEVAGFHLNDLLGGYLLGLHFLDIILLHPFLYNTCSIENGRADINVSLSKFSVQNVSIC